MQIPDVEIIKNERINISIWLVPIVALIISLWLAYQYFSQLGPKITIEFKSSAGLKAKQSQIKFRDVSIGTIKKIELKGGGEGVIITARINKDAEQLINKNAKFWIVKPTIDKSGITGLETLVSGSYIELYSKSGDELQYKFTGLEKPYKTQKKKDGNYYILDAPNSYDLDAGSLILYRNIKVGEVESVELSKDGKRVIFGIFVKKPYGKFINAKTQFSYMSNFKLDISKLRLDVSLASTSQIIYGGISFATPQININKSLFNIDHIFPLFASPAEASAKRVGFNSKNLKTYQMIFNQNLGKLPIGASVMFDNFQIGEVSNIQSQFDKQTSKIKSIAIVDIDSSVFNGEIPKNSVAKLAKSNPILDSLYIDIDIDIDKNSNNYKITKTEPYDIFPTKKVKFDDISNKINILLASVTDLVRNNKQPITKILKNLNTTIININKITKSKEFEELPQQLSGTLQELQSTLHSTQEMIGENSKMSDDISSTMKNLNKASISLERVLRKIDKKPNSLIFGD